MGTFCDFIFRGVGLDPHDSNGLSDPYIVIKVPSDITPADSSFQLSEIDKTAMQNFFQGGDKYNYSTYDPTADLGVLFFSLATRAIIHQARKTHKQTEGYFQLYESEVIKRDLNPCWMPFRLDMCLLCMGDLDVEILIECYDWDRIGSSDFIGSFTIPVRDLLSGGEEELAFQLYSEKGHESGVLGIKSKLSKPKTIFCDFKIEGNNLAETGVLGSSDPYLVIKTPYIDELPFLLPIDSDFVIPPVSSKCGENDHGETKGYREVYESPIFKKNLNPDWPPFRLSFYDLCRGKSNVQILIECWDYNTWTSNKLIGSALVTVSELLASQRLSIDLTNRKNENSGTIFIETSATSAAQTATGPSN